MTDYVEASVQQVARRDLASRLTPYLWILPGFILAAFVVGVPLVANIGSSFNVRTGSEVSLGVGNYEEIITDPQFYKSLLLTLIWTFGVTVMQFALGFLAALMADRASRYIRALRPILILPWALPGIVAAYIWVFMYDDHGLVNGLLQAIGIHSTTAWLANPSTAFLAVMVAAVWKGFPFYLLLLLAGLQSVPIETREAATLDGASAWQTLVRIVIPQMRAMIATSLALGLIATSNYFDGVYLMTGGGPNSATEILPVWVYNVAFAQFDIPRASALSVIILLTVILLMLLRGLAERLTSTKA